VARFALRVNQWHWTSRRLSSAGRPSLNDGADYVLDRWAAISTSSMHRGTNLTGFS
jgi:hypothetical protein